MLANKTSTSKIQDLEKVRGQELNPKYAEPGTGHYCFTATNKRLYHRLKWDISGWLEKNTSYHGFKGFGSLSVFRPGREIAFLYSSQVTNRSMFIMARQRFIQIRSKHHAS